MEKYQAAYKHASKQTATDLHTIAASPEMRALSTLSLPEVETAVAMIARLIPAGNVPAMILNGLARLPGRRSPAENTRRDVNLLFKGIDAMLDKAVYGAFFAGPAAVIWGYQNLLKLGGKEPQTAFPEGVWQFYADYALREDTARFTVETHGFDTVLGQHKIELSALNRLTAWVMTAVHALHAYESWLTNDWRERVYTTILQAVTAEKRDAAWYAGRYRAWERKRPYGRDHDAKAKETYAHYRRRHFDAFLSEALDKLDEQTRYAWSARVQEAKQTQPDYQKQLSILAYLEPAPYGETRRPIPLKSACVGLVYQGRYYLIPACHPHRERPPAFADVQAQVAAIMQQRPETTAVPLTAVANLPRRAWADLYSQLNQGVQDDLAQLRRAPILINADARSPHQSLSMLRQAERGVGGHPLTIFNTERSFVFDFSHIFFDGAGATALAEILTREALAWAAYLNSQAPSRSKPLPAMTPLTLPLTPNEWRAIGQAQGNRVEVSAETTAVHLKQVLTLRHLFKMRSGLLRLTVNDLLVLYRAIHAVTYTPAPQVMRALNQWQQTEPTETTAVSLAKEALAPASHTPAVLIPIDASKCDPKERVYPLVFEVPLYELDLLQLHDRTVAHMMAYKEAMPTVRDAAYDAFNESQRQYLATLAGFGKVLSKAKEIAGQGEGASQGAIRLLAHLPKPLQNLLDQIPNRFDVLNDLIKGREVFSNVGAVVPGSSICRFNTAKDDNDKKRLAWGVVTDAEGVMHLSLRDFRPHVSALAAAGQYRLAEMIVQDYLDTYAAGFNQFVDALRRITQASRDVTSRVTKDVNV